MSGFDADWLALREPFDRAARAPDLTDQFLRAIADRPRPDLIDLGGGTGANFRLLAPLIQRDQSWRLIDYDVRLMRDALDAIEAWAHAQDWSTDRANQDSISIVRGPWRWSLSTQAFDLSGSLEGLPIESADAIVTTAFLDLVSQDWVDRFAARVAQSPRPVLATLTVDGRRVWSPALETDPLISEAFLAHQGGDKGFGSSLGPAAGLRTVDALRACGLTVEHRSSDWVIRSDAHAAMIGRLLDEAIDVACAVYLDPDERRMIADWARDRRARIERGELTLTVGHLDLLARPGSG